MLGCVGKLLIVVSIVFQAYLLFSDAETANQFNTKLSAALTACICIPPNVAAFIQQHARLAVVCLLSSSALMLVFRWCIVKVFVLLGLLTILYIEHQPFTKVPCVGCQAFWQKVAVIGGIIYLMGRDCCFKKNCQK